MDRTLSDKKLTIPSPGEFTANKKRERLVTSFLASLGNESRIAYQADLRDFAESLGLNDIEQLGMWLVSQSHGDANFIVLSYQKETWYRVAPLPVISNCYQTQ